MSAKGLTELQATSHLLFFTHDLNINAPVLKTDLVLMLRQRGRTSYEKKAKSKNTKKEFFLSTFSTSYLSTSYLFTSMPLHTYSPIKFK